MQSVITHSDRWRWYREIESAPGSTCADNAFPPNGVKKEMEVNCPLSETCFFASIKSITQWRTVKATCTRAKEYLLWIFYLNLSWRETLLCDFIAMPQLHSAWWRSFVCSFGLEWVLVIFRSQIHFPKMRTLQFYKCKIVESLENKPFVIVALH